MKDDRVCLNSSVQKSISPRVRAGLVGGGLVYKAKWENDSITTLRFVIPKCNLMRDDGRKHGDRNNTSKKRGESKQDDLVECITITVT